MSFLGWRRTTASAPSTPTFRQQGARLPHWSAATAMRHVLSILKHTTHVQILSASGASRRPGEFAPLRLGPDIAVWPPVGLAPMAGITNAPFRAMCAAAGAPLCIRCGLDTFTLVDTPHSHRCFTLLSNSCYRVDSSQMLMSNVWWPQLCSVRRAASELS